MSTSKVWLTSDLHIRHNKVAIARGFDSADEHDATLIENFSAKINPRKDTLIVLGDIAFGAKSKLTSYVINQVCCAKYVRCVMGNHDKGHHLPDHWELLSSFVKDHIVFTHIPVSEYEFTDKGGRWAGNIHGHLHDKSIPDDRYLCVSLEQTDMMPVLLRDAVFMLSTAKQ